MARKRLKCGGRPKALLGAAISSGAMLAAAAMQVAATTAAANKQEKAIKEQAQKQANALNEVNENNTKNIQEQNELIESQEEKNRQLQQDFQMSMQMQMGQENEANRLEANKMQLKYGGKVKRQKLKSVTSYGGDNIPFKVKDGGVAIPVNVDYNGYGLYTFVGDTHNEKHKTPDGKTKTGIGLEFGNGNEVEVEDKEAMLVNGNNDAIVYSNHNIDGFKPAEAVLSGMNPIDVYKVQEIKKAIKGYNDDGTKNLKGRKHAKYGTSVSNLLGAGINTLGGRFVGSSTLSGIPQQTLASTIQPTAGPTTVTTPTTGYTGGKQTLTNNNFLGGYGGAAMVSGANLAGAGITTLGNILASNKIAKAYSAAGDILASAYRNMRNINVDWLDKDTFRPAYAMAVTRDPYYNVNPQIERINRDAAAEERAINRNTLSSASRLTRLAETNDRKQQRIGEQYAIKANQEEQQKRENAATRTEFSKFNAQQEMQALNDYTGYKLQAETTKANIANESILGAAGAQADALTQSTSIKGNALQQSLATIGSAIGLAGQAFGTAYDTNRALNNEYRWGIMGYDDSKQVDAAIANGDWQAARALYYKHINYDNPISQDMIKRLRYRFPNLIG